MLLNQTRTLASLIAWAIGTVPLLLALIEDSLVPRRHSDVESGFALMLYLLVLLGTMTGVVLAVRGMRAKPREERAALALLLNVLTVAGLALWIVVSILRVEAGG